MHSPQSDFYFFPLLFPPTGASPLHVSNTGRKLLVSCRGVRQGGGQDEVSGRMDRLVGSSQYQLPQQRESRGNYERVGRSEWGERPEYFFLFWQIINNCVATGFSPEITQCHVGRVMLAAGRKWYCSRQDVEVSRLSDRGNTRARTLH